MKELVMRASSAMKRAYAPYSHFCVGAAVLTEKGNIYSGCNIENASFGATNCAERTAIFKAVSEGETVIKAVAIVSGNGKPTPPCGICRQVMSEFMAEDGLVILGIKDAEAKIYMLNELLPERFIY
ncbi:MAG: cytidine deaminase [Eubacteriales bacterium]|nr:cytidine deaminase [Eubacteriales bacterium]